MKLRRYQVIYLLFFIFLFVVSYLLDIMGIFEFGPVNLLFLIWPLGMIIWGIEAIKSGTRRGFYSGFVLILIGVVFQLITAEALVLTEIFEFPLMGQLIVLVMLGFWPLLIVMVILGLILNLIISKFRKPEEIPSSKVKDSLDSKSE